MFEIKKATVNDVSLIFNFIKELAEYEKLLHKVVTTEEILKDSLFGKTPYAQVIIGYLNNKPVAFALYFYNFSTFIGRPGIYLEDLFVKPEARGEGVGYKILNHLGSLAKKQKCGRLEWWVLNWNESAINFYRKIGAKPMDEWTVFRLDQDALENLTKKI